MESKSINLKILIKSLPIYLRGVGLYVVGLWNSKSCQDKKFSISRRLVFFFFSHVNFKTITAFTPVFIKIYIRNIGSALPNVCPAEVLFSSNSLFGKKKKMTRFPLVGVIFVLLKCVFGLACRA